MPINKLSIKVLHEAMHTNQGQNDVECKLWLKKKIQFYHLIHKLIFNTTYLKTIDKKWGTNIMIYRIN
jgi:hypothetical protein